jgi:putative peptidoglycan lipid II flippase
MAVTDETTATGHMTDRIPLVPGASLVNRRYRLQDPHGGTGHLQFWRGVDTTLGREVALTLVDTDGAMPAGRINEILSHTVRLRGIHMPGVAPVLDVLHTGRFGLVVSGWIHGGSLRQVADTAPSPIGVAGAMQSLAAAAEAAHRSGLVLGIDHPSRLRISTEGCAALAFPATMPKRTPQDDLRGIGGAMYALLVDRWPAQEPMPSGWIPVEVDATGRVQEPAAIRSDIPFLLSATAAGLVRQDGGINSAETLLALLREVVAAAAESSHCRIMPPLALPPPGGYAAFRNFGEAERTEAARRHVLRACLGAVAAIIVVAVMMLGSTLNRVLGDHDAPVALDADKLGLNEEPAEPSSPERAAPAATDTGPVKPAEAAVFSPDGTPDNPQSAGLTIDGDAATAWSTQTYYDDVPFPKFKEGIGLLLQLRQPTALSAVTVDLNSTGTVVQIRSSPTASPAKLADTVALSPPTPLRPGHNSIPVNEPDATSTVLIWISTLGTADGKSRTDISEVGIVAAAPPT